MLKRLVVALLAYGLCVSPVSAEGPLVKKQEGTREARAEEYLADTAIAVIIVAASVAAYKAMGKPCACPNDTMKNGRTCGGNSAYMRPGGFKPLCSPKDISLEMIKAYRLTKAIPPL